MVRGGSTGGAEGAPAPLLPKTLWSPPKILETIDEEREGARKKKGHQPPYLPFLASPLTEPVFPFCHLCIMHSIFELVMS